MPKRVLPLSEGNIRCAIAKEVAYKLFDGRGLYLLVTPSGSKLWRYSYGFNGKKNTLSFGPYPEVSLSDARAKRDDAREQIVNGVDPGVVKKALKKKIKTAIARKIEKLKAKSREWR
ncbi:MAG: Prophage CP4-57 integrase [Syntrophorhabdaceae bacterium PtaU1.Bin034]|jgi:hypothetical protein|nr:MAG: Prophage CP4-57 integrase [Syntrophorhabdaceae bacterium PtaU1.Bin034]